MMFEVNNKAFSLGGGYGMSMKRKKHIMELLQQQGTLEIAELTEHFQVSSMTIRRDLDQLENEKKLIRTYGGATLAHPLKSERSFSDKQLEMLEQKQQIAEYAIPFIQPGMTLLLDSGTTTLEIAKRLSDIEQLTVVTNDIQIAAVLMNSKLDVYLLGGRVQNDVGAVFGNHAEEMLKELHVDLFFLGAHAIHPSFGITAPTIEKAALKRVMIRAAEQVYLVADTSKFNQKAFAKVCDLSSINGIITDDSLPQEIYTQYNELAELKKVVKK